MLKKLILLACGFPLLIELWLYAAGSKSGWIYAGIAKAAPRFRDVYILTINSKCARSAWLFQELGGCSNDFYGVREKVFDYPVGVFLITQKLPNYIFAHENLLGATLGTLLVCSLLMIITMSTNSAAGLLIGVASIYSKPLRYLLERSNMDTLTWLTALWAGFLLITRVKRRYQAVLLKALGSIMLSMSMAIKGFTLPTALVELIVINRERLQHRKLVSLATISAFTLGILSIATVRGGAGSYATTIQSTRGEVFGWAVGLDGISSILTKAIIIVVGFRMVSYLLTRKTIDGSLSNYSGLDIGSYLTVLGSTSMCMFYTFTVSADYKLVSINIVILGMVKRLTASQRQQKPKKDMALKLNECMVYMIFVSSLFMGYREYIPSLQFASQDLIDYLLHPYICGGCAALAYEGARSRILHLSSESHAST